ncbi:serine hydrolase [Kiritimatiellota bacterium B12222]|nr:serine hydrolase [Kiritimatiellota bacterium B12222]
MKKLENLCKAAIDAGREEDLHIAVYCEGELDLDLRVTSSEITPHADDLCPIFSCGKGVAATAVHRLVERGILSWDEPIAVYWPEFGCNGKEQITLRQVMAHNSGLPMMPESCPSLGTDWEAMCAFYATARPVHPPGEARHYHAVSYSWLVGETAHRADGRPFQQIIEEEVLAPLAIDDFFFGVPDSALTRCLDVLPPLKHHQAQADPLSTDPPDEWLAIPDYVLPLEAWIHRKEVRQACIPASNGFATARSLARHYASLVGEGVEGVRLLSEETLLQATLPAKGQASLQMPGAIGYQLRGGALEPGNVFGHGGYGGLLGIADKKRQLGIGILKTRMGGELTSQILEILQARYGSERK